MKKIFSAMVLFALMLSMLSLNVMAATNDSVEITEPEVISVRLLTIDELNEEESHSTRAWRTLFNGNINLGMGYFSHVTTKNGVYKECSQVITIRNNGDNQGNGAITVRIGTASQAIAAGSAAQFTVNSLHTNYIYATANWYAASYNLHVQVAGQYV